uniref:Syntaxin 10 n=1 Tax=Chrysemys picta bellii TaxID=8478 RepID=A0A8C3PD86_CHRPI
MALEDPFSAVRGEVQKAVNTARGLYERWGELLRETHVVSTEEFDWTTNELRNSLRSIDQKPPPERYGQLREELVSANSRYVEEQQLHQQVGSRQRPRAGAGGQGYALQRQGQM